MQKLGVYLITSLFVMLPDHVLQVLTIDLNMVRINILEIIFAISFIALLTTRLLRNNTGPKKKQIDLVFVLSTSLFLLLPLFRYIFFDDNIESITNIMNLMRPYTFFILLFALVGNCLKDKASVKHFLMFFVIICTLLAFKNIYYFLSGTGTALGGMYAVGGVLVPRQAGGDSLLIMGSLIFCIVVLYIKRLNKSFLVSLIPQAIGMFTIFSRATIFGLIAGLIACSVIFSRIKETLITVLLGMFGVVVVFWMGNIFIEQWSHGKISVFNLLRIEEIDTSTKKAGSITERYWEYAKIIEEIKKAPYFGHGLRASFYYYNYTTGNRIKRDFCHNAYLQVTWNFGIFGLVLFLSMLLRLFVRMVHLIRSTTDEYLKRVTRGIFGCYVAFLLILNSSPNVHTFRPMLFLGMITGLALAIEKINNGLVTR
jgi:O-antigen ligase